MTKKYPPPIISTEPGTWAHSTVATRFPETAARVIKENDFSSEINQALTNLKEEIPLVPIRNLEDKGAPDHEDWRSYIQPHLDQNWLTVPWFFSEHYFYRRIMEAVDYFNLGVDPFQYQKEEGLKTSTREIKSLARFLAERLAEPERIDAALREGIYFSLWGNQADLSLWPADGGERVDPRHSSSKMLKEHLLANDINQVIKRLMARDGKPGRVDLMLDNAGFELITDLALIDLVLSLGLADEVVLHTKAHPTFVSDVIDLDLQPALEFLLESEDQAVTQFGKRLKDHFEAGRLRSNPNFFWNSPRMMWDLPPDLAGDFSTSKLLICKGDANYRRILGDRDWDFTVPFHQAVDYLPVPIAALRTSKAELAVGLELEQIQEVYNQDRNWLVDGRWGVIHFSPKVKNEEEGVN